MSEMICCLFAVYSASDRAPLARSVSSSCRRCGGGWGGRRLLGCRAPHDRLNLFA